MKWWVFSKTILSLLKTVAKTVQLRT